MHERYAGKWYESLALVQTVQYLDVETATLDSARVWYESLELPGTVRSDIAPLDGGNRQVFHEGEWRVYQADSLVSARPGWHPVLLMGFDVYVQPADATQTILKGAGVDLEAVREGEWTGIPVWILGSGPDTEPAREFWIEKDRLLLVRILLRNADAGSTREVRFAGYEPLGGGWIATELSFLTDGRVDTYERYDYWAIDLAFDPAIFAREKAARPAWIRN
jgi:hypothetical protein